MNKTDALYELAEAVMHKLDEANSKLARSNVDLSGADIDYLDKLSHTLKSLLTSIAMTEEEGGFSEGGSYGDGGSYRGGSYGGGSYGGSYARGRSRSARRDSMGRYSRTGDFAEKMREMMDEAPDEQTRQSMQRMIAQMEK